jgi:glycosyltransferase involved in cell wall biosynthesis
VVYSGIEPKEVESAPQVDIKRELGLGPEAVIVGHIAQLVDHNGHQYLIDATPELLRMIPNAHVVIIGSGPLEKDLRARIQDKGLAGRIHMLGWRNDANGILKSFDLFVMPSHLEGMGTVVLDAFVASVPVVAASAGGLTETVKDGVTGRLVPVRDPKALAKAMIDALTKKDNSRRMAENAKKLLNEKYTADRMVEGVLGVYQELVH